jgi:hypothetical protein
MADVLGAKKDAFAEREEKFLRGDEPGDGL